MPYVIEKCERHGPRIWRNSQGKIGMSADTTGDRITGLSKLNFRAFTATDQRVNHIQTTANTGGTKRKAVEGTTHPITTVVTDKKRCDLACAEHSRSIAIPLNATQPTQTFINRSDLQHDLTMGQHTARAIIVKAEYRTLASHQTDGGTVGHAIAISVHPGHAVLQAQTVLPTEQQ